MLVGIKARQLRAHGNRLASSHKFHSSFQALQDTARLKLVTELLSQLISKTLTGHVEVCWLASSNKHRQTLRICSIMELIEFGCHHACATCGHPHMPQYILQACDRAPLWTICCQTQAGLYKPVSHRKLRVQAMMQKEQAL